MPDDILSQKLGLRPGQSALVLNAPPGYLPKLTGEEATQVQTSPGGKFDFVLAFVSSRTEVDKYAPTALQSIKPDGILWFSYPKTTSAVKAGINRDSGWDALTKQGFRPVSQRAIDATWSALRFRLASLVHPAKK